MRATWSITLVPHRGLPCTVRLFVLGTGSQGQAWHGEAGRLPVGRSAVNRNSDGPSSTRSMWA